jgi:hypothetical protein
MLLAKWGTIKPHLAIFFAASVAKYFTAQNQILSTECSLVPVSVTVIYLSVSTTRIKLKLSTFWMCVR